MAGADRRRRCPSDGALLPYWLGAAFIKLLGPWLEPGARRAHSVRAAAGRWCWCSPGTAAYHLARTEAAQPLPFAFGGEAASGRLRARDRRRRAARADRDARPAAARPRDDARAGAARQRVAVPLCDGGERRSAAARARLAVLLALPALAASGAPSVALALGVRRRASSAAVRALRAGARFAPWVVAGARCWRRSRRGCSAPGPGASAATPRRSVVALLHEPAGLVHLAGVAAGALDAVALAPPPLSGTSPMPLGCVAGEPGRLHRDGRLRPRADARRCRRWRCWPRSRCRPCSAAPPRRSTGSRCSSSASARSRSGSIYVVDADRRAGQAGGQRRQAGAGLHAAASRWLALVARRRRPRWPGCGWCSWRTGRHRAPAVEEPGAAGQRRRAVLAAR